MPSSRTKPASTRSIVAGAVGNVMEWFDFAVYGFFAPIIGKQFFPSQDPATSLLAAFGVFASGFIARPVGAAIFGHLGDRYGRVVVLRLSVILMGVSTTLVGLLPDYAAIGVAAPAALVVLRVLQGLSVGGEFTGSVIFLVERAPEGKRGIVGGWANFGAVAGFLLGSAAGAILSGTLSDAALVSWGWRVPFVLGISIAVTAFFFRRRIQTSPAEEAKSKRLPLVEAVHTEWRTMLRILGLVLTGNVGFYMMFVYVTTYLSEHVGVSMPRAMQIDTIAMVVLMVLTPIAALISDRLGRKPVLLVGSVGSLLLSVPLFFAINHDDTALILLGQLGFAVLVACAFGVNPATLVEITQAPYRCTTISVAYNVTLAIFGGTTPIVAAWLLDHLGDDMMPAYYVMVMAVVTTGVLLILPETAFRELDGAAPAEPEHTA